MIRKSLTVAAIAGASTLGLLSGQANAFYLGSVLPAVFLPTPSMQLSGTCVPEFVAAGIGSTGGLPYKVQGVGSSAYADTVATQVECKFYDLVTHSDMVVFKSLYKPGPAAALAVDYTVRTLDAFITCVKIDRVDSNGAETSTPWTSTDGSSCA